MARAFLGLGSNSGDRAGYLALARARLALAGPVRSSASYETEPVGLDRAPDFLNAVVALDTNLGPAELLQATAECEAELGRDRTEPALRTIDIDLLLYGSRRIDSQGLAVPHPRMHERAFVLGPLAEIAPGARHPQLGLTSREMLDRLASA